MKIELLASEIIPKVWITGKASIDDCLTRSYKVDDYDLVIFSKNGKLLRLFYMNDKKISKFIWHLKNLSEYIDTDYLKQIKYFKGMNDDHSLKDITNIVEKYPNILKDKSLEKDIIMNENKRISEILRKQKGCFYFTCHASPYSWTYLRWDCHLYNSQLETRIGYENLIKKPEKDKGVYKRFNNLDSYIKFIRKY